MRSATVKGVLEEVPSVALVLLLLLLVNFVSSVNAIVTNSTSSYETSLGSSLIQNNARTNNEGYTGSEQPPDQPSSNVTQSAISLKQKKDAHIRIIRDRERWRFIIMGRLWDIRRSTRRPSISLDSVGARGLELISEEENGRLNNGREHSELTTNIYLIPQCSGPHNFSGTWNDNTNFRLYFKMESLEASYRSRDIKVNSAFLYIKKKPSLVFGNHRPALTSARTGRQRVAGSDSGSDAAGSGFNGRASILRRQRSARDTERSASSSSSSSSSFASSSSSSPLFSRSDIGGGAISNMKIVVNAFSRNRRNRQEMRPVAVTPVSRQSTEWIRINLTQVVDDWLKRPARNLGLQMTLRSSVLPSSSEHNPDDYFEGAICSAQTGQSSPVHLSSPEESANQSSVDWTSAHPENIGHPFLEVVTGQVPRSRPRHRRHVKTDHRFEIPDQDVNSFKPSTFRKWMQRLRSSDVESSSSQTPRLSVASDSVFPLLE